MKLIDLMKNKVTWLVIILLLILNQESKKTGVLSVFGGGATAIGIIMLIIAAISIIGSGGLSLAVPGVLLFTVVGIIIVWLGSTTFTAGRALDGLGAMFNQPIIWIAVGLIVVIKVLKGKNE